MKTKIQTDNRKIETLQDVVKLINDLVTHLGLGFHPDNSMEDYIDGLTKEPTFSKEEAAKLEALLKQCHDAVTDEELYAIINTILMLKEIRLNTPWRDIASEYTSELIQALELIKFAEKNKIDTPIDLITNLLYATFGEQIEHQDEEAMDYFLRATDAESVEYVVNQITEQEKEEPQQDDGCTYYLFGGQAVDLLANGKIQQIIKTPSLLYSTYCWNPNADDDTAFPSSLLDAFTGWDAYTEISKKDYIKLTNNNNQ